MSPQTSTVYKTTRKIIFYQWIWCNFHNIKGFRGWISSKCFSPHQLVYVSCVNGWRVTIWAKAPVLKARWVTARPNVFLRTRNVYTKKKEENKCQDSVGKCCVLTLVCVCLCVSVCLKATPIQSGTRTESQHLNWDEAGCWKGWALNQHWGRLEMWRKVLLRVWHFSFHSVVQMGRLACF